MQRVILTLLLLGCCQLSAAEKELIIRSGDYYYGSGEATTVAEALNLAADNLCKMIAMQVSSSFERVVAEKEQNYQEKVESIVKTHTMATLKNVEQLPPRLLAENKYEVFVYLKKSQVEQIFAERKQLIAEMAAKANALAEELHLAQALKYYYFVAILINSLPDQLVVHNGINYTTEIPLRIDRLVSDLAFRFISARDISPQEREVMVEILYGGRPVSTLDFTFWDGSRQVTVSGRDGRAAFQLLGAAVHFAEIKVQPKYAYYESRNEIQSVATLWDLVIKPEFTGQHKVRLFSTADDAAVVEPNEDNESPVPNSTPVRALIRSVSPGTFAVKLDFTEDVDVAPLILDQVRKFLDVVAAGDPAGARHAFASDDFLAVKIADYLKYNRPRPLDQNIAAALTRTADGWELRRIRMLHRYPTLNKESTEYLTLDFTPEGKLCDLNVCITENLYQHFVRQAKIGADWRNRQQIIKFLEKYRTAYLTRDLPTVDLMFAEDAIIIVGRKLERRKLAENVVRYEKLGAQPDHEYLRLSKQLYLERQKQIFTQNQDISLDFSTFDIVKKNTQDSVYGVEMRQSYASTTYADEGYLFLLIDFRETDPLIYVRAWQPNAWSKDELIRTANYKIHQ
ncbi:MAG TPA: hypothetical protein PKW76_07510 [bacterium]|nr:hypothetical protein [bacterium]HPG45509.1 hypothetical protein [bacterium]HPM97712.1 hypothetical protein [bacterium]